MSDETKTGRIPVTVLTGFLGAGKTTLLNRILTENHGRRIAVIENEFGEIGIDQELVIRSDEELFEMNNGCICCTVRGDLIRILGGLVKRRQKFDHVLIETTGLADPGPVAQTFFTDEEIKEKYVLDGIVTVVDAKHVWQHLDSEREVKEQIGFADVVLLNKTDLVASGDLDRLESKVRQLNAPARIFRCRNADVEIAKLLSLGGFDLDRALELEPDFLVPGHHHHRGDHDDDHGHHDEQGAPDHVHDEEISSVGLTADRPLDMRKFDDWMGTVLREKGQGIFRMKGVLAFKGQDKRYLFQGVHQLFEGKADRPWKDGEARGSRLIFIGRNLDRQELTRGFEACLA